MFKLVFKSKNYSMAYRTSIGDLMVFDIYLSARNLGEMITRTFVVGLVSFSRDSQPVVELFKIVEFSTDEEKDEAKYEICEASVNYQNENFPGS